jgi:ATP-binding cassette subfamily C protein CydD
MRSLRLQIDGAAGCWIADTFGAILFAGGLAGAIVGLVDRRGIEVFGGILAILLAALVRALFQHHAAKAGFDRARHHKQKLRSRLYPILLTTRGGNRSIGEDLAMAVDHVEATEGFHARYAPLRAAAMCVPLLIAGATALASPICAAILLATLAPFGLGMALAGGAAGKAADRQLIALARLSGLFVDRIRALPVIIGFAAEGRIIAQMESATREVADRTLAVLRIAFLSGAVIEFFAALSVALIAVYCGFNLLGLLPFPVPEHLSLGRALFALALAPEYYLPMRRLAAAYHDKQVGEAAQARIDGVAIPSGGVPHPNPVGRLPALSGGQGCRTTPEGEGLCVAPPSPFASPSPLAEGLGWGLSTHTTLTIDNAIIAYPDGTSIGPISLSAPQNSLTALTGPSGSGKSSLLHAIIGLVPLSIGTIEGLRHPIGWAGQATALIPGSIADNIAIARNGADPAAIDAAARSAGLGPMIDSRPGGLATIVDHRGSGLSGGERRRIGLARAILRDAPVWLLDEPTADLDEASAQTVIALLVTAARRHIVIVATHHPGLIAAATQRIDMP